MHKDKIKEMLTNAYNKGYKQGRKRVVKETELLTHDTYDNLMLKNVALYPVGQAVEATMGWRCPTCEEWYPTRATARWKYCPLCGQKLKEIGDY